MLEDKPIWGHKENEIKGGLQEWRDDRRMQTSSTLLCCIAFPLLNADYASQVLISLERNIQTVQKSIRRSKLYYKKVEHFHFVFDFNDMTSNTS